MTKHREGLNVAELRDFKINPKTADPGTPTPGVIWTRSDQSHDIKYNNGTINQTIATQSWVQSDRIATSPYIGTTYPGTPTPGAVWFETNAGGTSLIGEWCWNGTYWLSVKPFYYDLTTLVANFSATSNRSYFPVDPSTNIFILNLIVSTIINTNSVPATNSWTWTLSRVNSPNTVTNLGTVNTGLQIANTWVTYKTAINLHIDVSATSTKALAIFESRVGALTKINGAMIEFKKARI